MSDQDKTIIWDWFELYQPNVDTDKARKPGRANRLWSLYRDGKQIGHTTRGGVGLVGQLLGRGRKRKKKRS